MDRAIRRGLDWLLSVQKPDGSWDTKYARQHPGGVEAMVLLAAAGAGDDLAQPRYALAMKYVNDLKPTTVYVRAARAMLYARLPADRFADRLAEDADWLAQNQHRTGGWGYGPGHRTTRENRAWTDISNTFLAMLALRDAQLAGAKVPSNVWARNRVYWSRAANADGGMGYQPPGGMGFRLRGSSYGSMTAAGATALCLLSDEWAANNEAPFTNTAQRRENPSPHQPALNRAMKWLAGSYSLKTNPKWVWVAGEAYEYYYLYVLQHLIDEAGLDRIGPKPLAPAAARVIVDRQHRQGSWGDPKQPPGGAPDNLLVIRTCFAVLSLLKARGAIVIQKLALGEQAANDPRDAACLARWIGRSFRWQASWRQVTAKTPNADLARAPLLYIQTSLTDYPKTLDAKVRSFLATGGTLIVQPFAGRKDLVQAAEAFLRRALPDCTLAPVPDGHPVYSVHFKVPLAGRPRLLGLADGCRIRAFLLTSDVSGAWHQGRTQSHPQLFQLAANLLLYTTDLSRPKGKLRLATPRPRRPAAPRTVRMARIQHDGDWNVCPGALGRVGDVLTEALSLGVTVAPPVDLAKPVPASLRLLWMTGTRPAKLSRDQQGNLKTYLASGGMLFVDSAMGGGKFARSATLTLAEMFGPANVKDLPATHPLLTGAFARGMGCDVTKVRYTRAAADELPADQPPKLSVVLLDGRVVAVFSPYSVTCPLLAQPTFGCKGLSAPDAARLAANLTLYATTQAPD